MHSADIHDTSPIWLGERIESGPARLAIASCFFLNGALFATWVSRIPAVQASLGLSHAGLGMALLSVAAGALVAMPLAGIAASRFGSHRVTQLSAILYCMMLPPLALAHDRIVFAAVLFGFGAAHGAFDVAMNGQAVAIESRSRRKSMSGLHAFWSFGGLTGAAIGGFAAAGEIAPATHFAAASLLLGGATVLLALPRLLDARLTEVFAATGAGAKSPRRTRPPRILFVLGIVAFCIMMGEGAMADWSAVFLRDAMGTTEGVAAAGYAAYSIAMAIARLFGDALSSRVGSVAVVRAGSGLAAAGMMLALVTGDTGFALAGFAAVGAGFAAIVPQVFSAAARTPGIAVGPALATATTFGYTGFLVGPPMIGVAAESVGLRGAMGIIIATTLIAFALAPSVATQAGKEAERLRC